MASKSMEEIASLLKAVKFKKRLFFGVDEDDVWHVLEQMQTEYRKGVEAIELRYSALLDERNDIISELKNQLAKFQSQSSLNNEGGGADD